SQFLLPLARQIQQEMEQASPQYYIPDQSDTARFNPIPFVNEPIPADQLSDEVASPAEPAPEPTPAVHAAPEPPPQPTGQLTQPQATHYVLDYLPFLTPPYAVLGG